jgi:hypothetical protein
VVSKPDDKKPPAVARESKAPESSNEDVALVYGVSDDGGGLDILRRRQGRFEAGTVRPLEEGKPIRGEVVRLKPRKHSPLVCDVESEFSAELTRAGTSNGPAQVATDQYRKNWDAIYNKGGRKPPLLN